MELILKLILNLFFFISEKANVDIRIEKYCDIMEKDVQ